MYGIIYGIMFGCTAEDATRNSLDVRQVYNDKVGAKMRVK